MVDINHPLSQLLKRDQRYRFEAYLFVFESLRYAQEKLGMGVEHSRYDDETFASSESHDDLDEDLREPWQSPDDAQRHVSGQELCKAMRLYALDQYGFLAKKVLNHWGIVSTNDIGEIVFNLIEIEQMRKTPDDCREDFDGVFDFAEAFQYSFEFSSADSSEEPRR